MPTSTKNCGNVYVTKWATTRGILRCTTGTFQRMDAPSTVIYFVMDGPGCGGGFGGYVSDKNWTPDLAVAQARAKKMVANRIRSLQKQIEAVQAVDIVNPRGQ